MATLTAIAIVIRFYLRWLRKVKVDRGVHATASNAMVRSSLSSTRSATTIASPSWCGLTIQ
ncbi:MAG: hypothetical protein HS109_06815 [Burkholderiales bacterium]|nr:hypothetical protein [Burkholderiales bacterium]